jgi:hypothetical protein
MSNKPHWIKTINGYAGRKGYIVKVKGGYNGYFYTDPNFFPFNLASEAKHFFDKELEP